MEQAAAHTSACDGCAQPTFELHVIADQKLCAPCSEASKRIARLLATTHAGDLVTCDGCKTPVAFDARRAVIERECGGGVLCEQCKAVEIEGGSS